MPANSPLKIIFAGTPDFSAEILSQLLKANYHIAAVYCQPDRRVGRGKKLVHGPVKKLALENNIPVEQPLRFNQDKDLDELTPLEKLQSYQADLMIVVAYGLILPQEVLTSPKFGCVNIHASILPRWRGAAPIQRAIQQGDKETGITIMQMDQGLDTGNMLLTRTCPIENTDTGSSLHNKLASLGGQAILEFLNDFSKETGSPLSPGDVQDDSLANYAHKLSKQEAEIDWNQPAASIERQIRAFCDWPVSFTHINGNRLRIWEANFESYSQKPHEAGKIISTDKEVIRVVCGDGNLVKITKLQADGSRAMSAADLLNGNSQWFSNNPVLGK